MLRASIKSSTTGYGIELLKDIKYVVPVAKGTINVQFTLPTLLTKNNKYNNEISALKTFLDVEGGSIAVSQTKCITHHIDIALSAKHKRFTKTFLDSVLALQEASEVFLILYLVIKHKIMSRYLIKTLQFLPCHLTFRTPSTFKRGYSKTL